MEKNSVYLVKINCLLAELRREIHQLIFILSQVVHLHEVVVVLKLAEDGVLLSDGAETGVGVVPRVLTLALEGLTALRQILKVGNVLNSISIFDLSNCQHSNVIKNQLKGSKV